MNDQITYRGEIWNYRFVCAGDFVVVFAIIEERINSKIWIKSIRRAIDFYGSDDMVI
jgi:hypothetical protein